MDSPSIQLGSEWHSGAIYVLAGQTLILHFPPIERSELTARTLRNGASVKIGIGVYEGKNKCRSGGRGSQARSGARDSQLLPGSGIISRTRGARAAGEFRNALLDGVRGTRDRSRELSDRT